MTADTPISPTASPFFPRRATPKKEQLRFATNTQSSENVILCHRVTSDKNIKNPDVHTANDRNSTKRIFPDTTPMGHAPGHHRPPVREAAKKAYRQILRYFQKTIYLTVFFFQTNFFLVVVTN
jgi:hypothetical protein